MIYYINLKQFLAIMVQTIYCLTACKHDKSLNRMRNYAMFLTLCLSLFQIQCGGNSGFTILDEIELFPDSDIMIKDFETNNYKEKRLLWNMKSEKAYLFNNTGDTEFVKVNVINYDADGTTTTARGNKGRFYQKERVMELENNVIVRAANGRKLYTEFLTWTENTKTMDTNRYVKIIFPEGDVIIGLNGMTADQGLDKIIIHQGIGYHPPEKNK
jgi:LPS export ABC transporter protein LptC